MTDEERQAVVSQALEMSAEAQAELWDRINANKAKIREREAHKGQGPKEEVCLAQQ